jgi:hypothetical protein
VRRASEPNAQVIVQNIFRQPIYQTSARMVLCRKRTSVTLVTAKIFNTHLPAAGIVFIFRVNVNLFPFQRDNMETDDAAWSSHRWLLPQPRRLEVESGEAVLQRHCVQCGRDFITRMTSGSRFAVFISATSFHRLVDEVTERWLRQPCPGTRTSSDEVDRSKRVAQYTVSTAQVHAS